VSRRAALLALLLAAAGCALNPVSGRRELALISESQEIEMGRQGAAQVAATIGLHPDAGLQAYVEQPIKRVTGTALPRVSIRP
jgi:predicted Zn-dependent protease